MSGAAPLVSVVMATYNRPRVLAYAIRSVIAQTLADWELIVVGDACGPETGDVVASFGDPRIRYRNLAVNFGEQSGPNNTGVAMARGQYLAFLNHDDLWFPGRLATGIADIEKSRADLVFAQVAWIRPAEAGAIERDDWQAAPGTAHRRGRYDPLFTMAPASSWILKRGVSARVGPWRPAAKLYAESSQDFLFRAWRQGHRLVLGQETTVIMFSSAWRERTYVSDPDFEHAYFWRRLCDDPAHLGADIQARLQSPAPRAVSLDRKAKDIAWRALAHLGVSPREAIQRRHGHQRGQALRWLRRNRGLPEQAG
jgi:glycosyltransferase involved in cell wall biosynthesis